MVFRTLLSLAFAPLLLISSAHAVVEDWFVDKAISYRQSGDDSQATTPSGWTIEIGVSTTDPGDFGSASISRVGSATIHSLDFEGGEWVFERDYDSEADMNLEFPSSSNYTITLSGGSLGPATQTFTLGAANYPEAPYLTGSDYSRVQSADATADFTLRWNDPGGFANAAALEIEERTNQEIVDEYEFDGSPLPTFLSIPASTLSPGYCYEGYLSFLNTTETNGIGGFGIPGYIEHSSNLSFEIQTVLSPNPDAIVGAWQFGDGAANGSGVLVFQANGVFFHAEDGEGTSQDDIETGTYSWNADTGIFTANIVVDENGDIGLSHPDGPTTITIDGDTLTLTDDSESSPLQRVAFDPASWIEGGWRICDNDGSDTGVLVFLGNGTYFHAELNDGDPAGANGIERGTYSWNSSSGALSVTQAIDTNGDLGLSAPIGSFVANLPGPRVLSLSDGDPSSLHRVTNAAVKPEWRLNKARSHHQTADNTQPSSATFWDVFALVETRNGADASRITLSSGGLSSPVDLTQEDPGEWSYDFDYASQALLDTDFPDGQTYTLTISGGELGTVAQQINIGNSAYPTVPFLTDSGFTDAQSIDPTSDFDIDWNHPSGATVHLVVSSMPDEDGTVFYDEMFFSGTTEGTTLPALSLPAGQMGYGYLEFSNGSTTSTGSGGFGASGFSGRQSITFDFPVNAQSADDLVNSAAADAGLMGPAAEPDAIPFSDGVENILKYAFNMELGGPDSSSLAPGTGNSGLPVFSLDNGGPSTEFKVEFVRRKGSGLVYTAKRSADLGDGSFTPMTGSVTVTPIDDQFERVVVSEPCDPEVVPRCFGIVEVTAP